MDALKLGGWLAVQRAAAGKGKRLPFRKVERETGIAQNQLSRIERGLLPGVTFGTIHKLVRYYKVKNVDFSEFD